MITVVKLDMVLKEEVQSYLALPGERFNIKRKILWQEDDTF